MRFKIGKSNLLHAVGVVQSVISSKAPVASLSSIKVVASKGQVTFTGTDLKVTAEVTLPVEVLEEGAISVHAPSLFDVVRELPDSEVDIGGSDNTDVKIQCEGASFKLHTSPIEDFPEIPEPESDVSFKLVSGQLLQVLSNVEFSISRDQSRYILTGSYLEVDGSILRAVSTDGRRMSIATTVMEQSPDVEFTAVIPHKTVQELLRVLPNTSEVEVKAGKSRIAFIFDGMRIISTVLEGRYPDYKHALPKDFDKEIVMDTIQLASAIRRVAAVATRNYNCIRMEFGKKSVTLTSATPEIGEAREDVPLESGADDVDVAFNPDYLLDVLKVISTEKAVLRMREANSAGLFQGLDDDSAQFVVMPIRL
jgi:DNA polymerase-3 subunit beta